MTANSSADHQTKDRIQSSQPQSAKQWDGTDIFRNELCDAERFLEDLGFAGVVDPAIPERFVPSLLHRISTMPRTALWYLNHRILHTLVLHKRKEQRRKLFRYSSVNNKELIESRSQILSLLHHHVAEGGIGKESSLVRSLTGPADCSEKDVLSACQSACRCGNVRSRANSIAVANISSSNTPASNIQCPISIYIEPPEDNQSETEDTFDDSEKPNTFNEGVVNSAEANPIINPQEGSLASKSVQESSRLPAVTCPSQSTLGRSYSEYSKDQRRMVLQRCAAISRRRSASEPIIFQSSQIGFGCFPRKHVDSHTSDKQPPKDALLPFSSQTLLAHNEIPFLRFEEPFMRLNNNVKINVWKNYIRLTDNYSLEIHVKNAAERMSFARQNFIESKSCFQRNLPTTRISLSFDENSRRNIRLPFNYGKLKDAFIPFTNTTDFKSIVTPRGGQNFSTTNQLYLVKQFATDNLESLLSECFFSLRKDNSGYYHSVAKTSSYLDEKSSLAKKTLLAYHFLKHFKESKHKTISRYLLIRQGKIDNAQFVCSSDDNIMVFEQTNTPPELLTIFSMAENFLSKSDSCLRFSSGFNIDIRPGGPSPPCFSSAVSLQFTNSKQLLDEPLTKDKNTEDKDEKKTHIIKYNEPPSHSFFRKATREIIELQQFIQQAKLSRESASAELKALQGILLEPRTESNVETSSHNNRELNTSAEEQSPKLEDTFRIYHGQQIPEDDASVSPPIHTKDVKALTNVASQSEKDKKLILRQLRRNILRVEQRHSEDISRMEKTLQLVRSETSKDSRGNWDRVDALHLLILQLQNEMIRFQQALTELQRNARASEESVSAHTEKEIGSKIQLELEQECNSRVSKMEAKLKAAEQQLRILQEENEDLRRQLLLESGSNSSLRQRTIDHQKSISPLVNGFTPNGDINCLHIEEKKANEEKLREELRETEKRADRLSLMLDEKVVELNKLQLSLSKRTKEMVYVERAYVQMIYHLYRNNNSLRSVNNVSSPLLSKDKEDPP